ncbi:MAG: CinA family protein [Alphaproteobacteria bacterium]|nr:CinA family protein [Alphaproteobacteria bacterium]MBL7096665.1 CinA family protein [Alphaproteobacteria bacterium]
MHELLPLAEQVGQRLKDRKETISVAESSSGGLLSAMLLAVPGASAYFLGGAVVYTAKARVLLMDLPREAVAGMRSSSEPYARLLARTARERFSTTWGLSETGAAGPTGNPYGDAAGHTCIALDGPLKFAITIETAQSDRVANMIAFTRAALELLREAIA